MPKFIHFDYNQSSMVVINLEEQLQLGSFEHATLHLIDNNLDMSVFNSRVKMMKQAARLLIHKSC